MSGPTIQVSNASFAFNEKTVFSHLSFELPAGKWTGLLGPSGVGKTTLLKMIAGLIKPQYTSLSITSTTHLPISQQIAFMAQSDLLLPWATVLDNVLLSVKLATYSSAEKKQKKALAISLLERVGLTQTFSLYPYQLSGGMRQRVALVRTLLTEKPIILMDEPFSALDAITRYKLQALAAQVLADKTVFFITHDPLEALRLANLIYVMKGHPAKLKAIATISSPIPRELNNPEIAALQGPLYHELMAEDQE